MGFSRQEYWSGLPFPSPGNLPDPGIETMSPALQADSLLSEQPGKSKGMLWLKCRLIYSLKSHDTKPTPPAALSPACPPLPTPTGATLAALASSTSGSPLGCPWPHPTPTPLGTGIFLGHNSDHISPILKPFTEYATFSHFEKNCLKDD